MESDNVDHDKQIVIPSMTFSLAFKVTVCLLLTLTCFMKIITLVHDKELTINKLSLLPYLICGCQVFESMLYYAAFAIWDIQDLPLAQYAIWRSILSQPGHVFSSASFVMLSCYPCLLGELLLY